MKIFASKSFGSSFILAFEYTRRKIILHACHNNSKVKYIITTWSIICYHSKRIVKSSLKVSCANLHMKAFFIFSNDWIITFLKRIISTMKTYIICYQEFGLCANLFVYVWVKKINYRRISSCNLLHFMPDIHGLIIILKKDPFSISYSYIK